MFRIGLAVMLVLASCAEANSAAADPESVFAALAQAARRGDQAEINRLTDKPQTTAARQAQHDQLTGHGRWLKTPDATCAAWRPLRPRWMVDPDAPLTAAELTTWLNAGPGEPEIREVDDDTVHVDIPYGVTAATLELSEEAGQWLVTAVFIPTEVPPPPQFVCVEPISS